MIISYKPLKIFFGISLLNNRDSFSSIKQASLRNFLFFLTSFLSFLFLYRVLSFLLFLLRKRRNLSNKPISFFLAFLLSPIKKGKSFREKTKPILLGFPLYFISEISIIGKKGNVFSVLKAGFEKEEPPLSKKRMFLSLVFFFPEDSGESFSWISFFIQVSGIKESISKFKIIEILNEKKS